MVVRLILYFMTGERERKKEMRIPIFIVPISLSLSLSLHSFLPSPDKVSAKVL